jgi:hypothetical protein
VPSVDLRKGQVRKTLNSNRLRYLCPALVLLTFQSAKINSGYGKTAMVQKPAYVFYCLSGIPTELGGCVLKNVNSR